MHRVKLSLFFALMCFCTSSFAQDSTALTGNWISESANGVFTQLEVSDSGSFVYRSLHANTLRRAYMCGHLTDLGDALSLSTGVIKERDTNGIIEQSVGEVTVTVDVLRRSERTLVVVIDDETVVLELS
ncbi:MAG: hypothetical protein AB8G17_19860 [Gammaproteobacteria bacterium]